MFKSAILFSICSLVISVNTYASEILPNTRDVQFFIGPFSAKCTSGQVTDFEFDAATISLMIPNGNDKNSNSLEEVTLIIQNQIGKLKNYNLFLDVNNSIVIKNNNQRFILGQLKTQEVEEKCRTGYVSSDGRVYFSKQILDLLPSNDVTISRTVSKCNSKFVDFFSRMIFRNVDYSITIHSEADDIQFTNEEYSGLKSRFLFESNRECSLWTSRWAQ